MLSFPWPLLEEALSIFNIAIFCKKFEKELIKTNDTAINAESQAF
jgi:hypothetical protein